MVMRAGVNSVFCTRFQVQPRVKSLENKALGWE